MTDSHLSNTIAFLERFTTKEEVRMALVPNPFHGEHAAGLFDNGQDAILEEGLEPSEVCGLYDNLITEQQRRTYGPRKIKQR